MIEPTKEGRAPYYVPSLQRECETYFKVFGDLQNGRTPLVVLHGGPGSGHDYMLPFGDLWSMHGIPVVLYDQIGCGGSTHLREKIGDEAFWKVDLFAAELENLLKYLQINLPDGPGFDLLGHSWGAMLATVYSAQQPPGLRRLLLTGPLSNGQLFAEGVWKLARQLSQPAQEAIEEAVRKHDFTSQPYLAALAEFTRTFMCRADPPPSEMVMSIKHQIEDPTVRESIDFKPSFWVSESVLVRMDLIPILPRINVPTFVLNAEFDTAQYEIVVPFFNHIPRVRWVTLLNASHSAHLDSSENRQRVLELVGEFLQQG